MARELFPLPVEASLLRICAHGLIPATAASTVTQAVENLLAVQGQNVKALPHALIVRTQGSAQQPGASGADVAHAFNSGQLVRHRPMRGTVHITTAQDYHWMRLTLKCRYEANNKEKASLGINDAVLEQAADVAWAFIAQGQGRTTRQELFTAWSQQLDTTHLKNAEEERRWCQWLMWSLDSYGAVIEGPIGKNAHYFIDARTLPAADSPESGHAVSAERYEEGRVEVARRYIHGHGPVSIDDFARWANLPIGQATTAMEEALEADSSLIRVTWDEGKLLPAETPRNPRQRAATHYMRADLPDILVENRADAERLMFLPAFDELHVGYLNRTCLTDEDGEYLICPTRNGLLRPLIVRGGRLVGVRPVKDGVQWVSPEDSVNAEELDTLVEAMTQALAR